MGLNPVQTQTTREHCRKIQKVRRTDNLVLLLLKGYTPRQATHYSVNML